MVKILQYIFYFTIGDTESIDDKQVWVYLSL